MKVKFWGVCGSVPAPMTTERFRRKVSSIIQRITPADLEAPEKKEKFLAQLPVSLFSVTGGNTTCIEIRLSDDTLVIVDAGTGLRELGKYLEEKEQQIRRCHIFLTHFHWDHIQGIPFFQPAYNPNWHITFYSPDDDFEKLLKNQMQSPYFPISMEDFKAKIDFITLKDDFHLKGCQVSYRKVLHPGGCYSYKFTDAGKSLIVSTDTELKEADFAEAEENICFYRNTDMIVLDSQYTPEEAAMKQDWGHSSYSLGVDFVSRWNIKNFVLFHYNPDYSDAKIYDIKDATEWYSKHINNFRSNIILAREGLVLDV